MGTRFDLSKVELAHMGSDGEAQYLSGFLRCGCEEAHSIDPFHVNRKVRSCFKREDKALADNILGTVIGGDAAAAAELVELSGKLGIAKENYAEVAFFLRGNAELIYRPGAASLSTMEAEQQHVYGAGMDSAPCGWSIVGADAMARIRSRMASGRGLPRLTRELSATPRPGRLKRWRLWWTRRSRWVSARGAGPSTSRRWLACQPKCAMLQASIPAWSQPAGRVRPPSK